MSGPPNLGGPASVRTTDCCACLTIRRRVAPRQPPLLDCRSPVALATRECNGDAARSEPVTSSEGPRTSRGRRCAEGNPVARAARSGRQSDRDPAGGHADELDDPQAGREVAGHDRGDRELVHVVVALLLASTVLAGIARAINVHYAIVLVLGGLVVGLVSGTSAPRVDPDVVLFVFLPPLVYAASFGSSTQDLRAHAQAIGLLAVGLVLVTMGAVAVVAHAVAHIGWGPALVLGAILGPTDPIAATSVLRRLGAPDRISTILEGEALVNDGTGEERGRRGCVGRTCLFAVRASWRDLGSACSTRGLRSEINPRFNPGADDRRALEADHGAYDNYRLPHQRSVRPDRLPSGSRARARPPQRDHPAGDRRLRRASVRALDPDRRQRPRADRRARDRRPRARCRQRLRYPRPCRREWSRGRARRLDRRRAADRRDRLADGVRVRALARRAPRGRELQLSPTRSAPPPGRWRWC